MGLHNPYIDVILSHTERAEERESHLIIWLHNTLRESKELLIHTI